MDFSDSLVNIVQTLAEDFVKNQSSTFDYNVIIRQEEKNIENEQKGKGRKKKGKRSKKNKDNSSNIIYGAWRTAQCVPSGEPCYVGDSCCNGDKCPSCNIGPCLCD